MNEKDTALLSDDYGRDLASVQALQRKHEGLERDLAALEDKVRPNTGALYSLVLKLHLANCSLVSLHLPLSYVVGMHMEMITRL